MLFARLNGFVERHDLGAVLPQDTGFKIAADPDTVRAADVAFVAREGAGLVRTEGYAELAPDLVVEVLSPGDRPGQVLEKVSDWLTAGTRFVWVLDPRRRQARVYRADGSVGLLESHDALDGEDVVPGSVARSPNCGRDGGDADGEWRRQRGEGSLRRVTKTTLVTADELQRLSIPNKQVELVRGVVVVRELPGGYHGALANELAHRLTVFVKAGSLGTVFGQDTGFKIAADPDTVRAPDVAFVSRDRLPGIPPEGYPELAPDLVVVLAKVAEWLQAGSRLVWLLDPEGREARLHRADGTILVLGPRDVFDGENVLPGFHRSDRGDSVLIE
jgi:Uma2 family endonuclease